MYYVKNIRFVAQPDGVHEMDGIVGTGLHRSEFVILECINQYDGKYNFIYELDVTTTPYRGYEHRFLTEEEKKYRPLTTRVFTREGDEGEKLVSPADSYYLPEQCIRLLCPTGEGGFPEKPFGRIQGHEIEIWGQGNWSPSGKIA